ncbi:cuticle protein 10.9-like [Centruroides vittatus]|uniref:cuticle protein 10.9-like n=1 Tax=Centruroides vittatus TaxID=120091 RepID=UPI00350F3F73
MLCKLALLFAVAGIAVAGIVRPPKRFPGPYYDDGPYGPVKEYRAPKPYDFGYETKDEFGATQNRQESSDGVGVKGSYGYTDPFGIFRQVDYIADEFGFRAKVRTNEPGTANQDPADVLVDADPVPGPVGPVKKVVPALPPLGPPVRGPPVVKTIVKDYY